MEEARRQALGDGVLAVGEVHPVLVDGRVRAVALRAPPASADELLVLRPVRGALVEGSAREVERDQALAALHRLEESLLRLGRPAARLLVRLLVVEEEDVVARQVFRVQVLRRIQGLPYLETS